MTSNRLSFAVLAVAVCTCVAACNKQVDSTQTHAVTNPEVAELTKQIRRYSFEKRKLPQTLEELVVAGYIQAVPKAPAGKRYAIDSDRAQATLVDQ